VVEAMSLSNRTRFDDQDIQQVDTWNDLENFSASPDQKQKAPLLTVDEIEAMQQQAYREAFEQGRQEGFKQGHEEGFKQGREAGYQEGYEEGASKGYQENSERLKQQAAEFSALLESLHEPFKRLDERVETALVDLVIGIATQLIRREIKTDKGQIVAVVREAVKALPVSSQKIILRLHPEDAKLVINAFKLNDAHSLQWQIEEDPLLTRGGCIVETDDSHVEATVENRLAAIVAKLLGGERQEDRQDAADHDSPG
jgi:flagellar assembly protein FliH